MLIANREPQANLPSNESEYTHTNDVARFGAHKFLAEGSESRTEPYLCWPKNLKQQRLAEARITQLTILMVNKYRYESSKRAISAGMELDILKRLQEKERLEVVDDILLPLEMEFGIHEEENGLVTPETPREVMDGLMDYYDCVEHALENIMVHIGHQQIYRRGLIYMKPPADS